MLRSVWTKNGRGDLSKRLKPLKNAKDEDKMEEFDRNLSQKGKFSFLEVTAGSSFQLFNVA